MLRLRSVIWDYGLVRPSLPMLDKCKALINDHGQWSQQRTSVRFTPTPAWLGAFIRKLDILTTDDALNLTFRWPGWMPYEGKLSFADGYAADKSINPDARTDVSMWHTDYRGWRYVSMWSNNGPTEFLLPSGDVIRPRAGHLMVIDNQSVLHRTGRRRFDADNRYFFRAGVTSSARPWKPLDKYRIAN